ncbi:MAG: hypothetical protein K0R43_4259, partial [Pseudoduganella sp.]|nr:hypothetical protein [Pseudoduganella sp.]
ANLATEEAKAHFFSIPTYDWAGLCLTTKKDTGHKKDEPIPKPASVPTFAS